jgi:hypothetical protein
MLRMRLVILAGSLMAVFGAASGFGASGFG